MRIREVEWPRGIRDKVERLHGLAPAQVESALLSERIYIRRAREGRYFVFGRSEDGAYIISVVVYSSAIARVISARSMTGSERRTYQRLGK